MTDALEHKPVKDELPTIRIAEVVEALGEVLKGDGEFAMPGGDFKDSELQDAVHKAVGEALDITPINAIAKAWTSITEVGKLIGPKGPQDGKTRNVAVAKHSLKAAHNPEIHIKIGQMITAKRIVLNVQFKLSVEGLVLAVKDREIQQISSGHAQPEVTIAVEKVTIVKEKLPRITLPMNVKFYENKPDTTVPTPVPVTA